MVRIHCLGGCMEVGKNAFLIDSKAGKIMMDYGMKVESGEAPKPPQPKVDALFITHGHLDHLGAAPVLQKMKRCKVYSTSPTFDFSNLLLRDSLKIARLKRRRFLYMPADILNMNRNYRKVQYGDEIKVGKAKVEVWDAGHIPGSCIFVTKVDGKKIMYTGDFKLEKTKLVHGARFDAKNIHTVIMESTYSSRDHPPRDEAEKQMFKVIKETVDNGGIALLPSYAGRAPELLMVINKFKPDFPVYLDGMAKDATSIALAYPEYIKDYKALKAATTNTIPLFDQEERNNAMKDPGVIVTTGGAMEGGPIIHYMKKLYSRPDCTLIFTGFQIPKTAGRYLVDTGRFVVGDLDFKVKMRIEQFDFSAHAGRSELIKFVQKIKPKKVIVIHGEYCEKFATELKGRFGIQAIAPKNGDIVKL